MNRRDFLKLYCVAIVSTALTACGDKKPSPTQSPLPVKPGVVKYTFLLTPGSPEETSLLLDRETSVVVDSIRTADVGRSWTYHFAISRGVSGTLTFECDRYLTLQITNADGTPLQTAEDIHGNVHQISFVKPDNDPAGDSIRIRFAATQEAIAVKNIRLMLQLPDTNGDGIIDALALLMGAAVEAPINVIPLPAQPYTSFFYGGDYDPRLASPTDIVRLYTYSSTWADKGYPTQVMVHSRFRPPGEPSFEEIQTGANGDLWGVAYVKRDSSLIDVSVGALSTSLKLQFIKRYGTNVTISIDEDYYKVPTPARNEVAKYYYLEQLASGAAGIGYDEPEYRAATGYSQAFNEEWQSYYGTPWEPPGSSVHARYQAKHLKGWLFNRQVKAILSNAQHRKPEATRLLALHSPVNYYEMGIVTAQTQLIQLPEVQEIIAEVWSGIAKLPELMEGKRATYTFEVALLEYASFWNLVRGLGKRLCFLQDPMEDQPNLSLQEYIANYSQTVGLP